ncbi:MAG: family 10 glycosylhydrolase [Bacteroidota bacterium]|nr:family 10 glycosylhydrolase [Bacteroidota bacterium]
MSKYPATFLILTFSLFVNQLSAQPKYEFRGVWVATVDNIDFPSTKFLNSFAQRAEFVNLLDMHQRNGMNAVVVQIRPATDAFYPSQYEPWSEWLTGTQGKPPSPYYDPLEFMITETHKRGMEFHAWMNPYRAVFNIGKSSISPTHITRLHPEWFLDYGGQRYFDPGNKDGQRFVANVVRDVVHRYKIDAIHFDDYFYPYRIAGKEFGDTESYRKYGNGLDRETWRRSNVDSIIVKLSHVIKQENKYCKFGISPFGVWRNIDKDPEGSNTKAGQTNYDDLYADILLWLKNKWIDYVAPQLYWEVGHKVVGYEVLIDWWAKHAYGRQMYIGQGIYRAMESKSYAWKNKSELPNQIKRLREYPQIQGSIFFSSASFKSNPNGWSDTLRTNYYAYPAIVPPMPWIDSIKPSRPILLFDSAKVEIYDHTINLYLRDDSLIKNLNRYVIYNFEDTDRIDKSDVRNITEIIVSGNNLYSFNLDNIPGGQDKIVIAATALTSTNNESELSRYIYLERKANGWHVVPNENNK